MLSFGWNSAGMGLEGFRRLEILLVAHGGAHNDTICVADEATADIILRQASFMEPEFPSKA